MLVQIQSASPAPVGKLGKVGSFKFSVFCRFDSCRGYFGGVDKVGKVAGFKPQDGVTPKFGGSIPSVPTMSEEGREKEKSIDWISDRGSDRIEGIVLPKSSYKSSNPEDDPRVAKKDR